MYQRLPRVVRNLVSTEVSGTRSALPLNVVAAALVASVVLTGAASAQVGGTDWPYYRRDLQLTGRSPGKGNLDRAPREKWKLYLGGWDGLLSVRHRAGANKEVRFTAGESFGQDYRARTSSRWDAPPLVDLAGDGKRVPAPPGKVAKLLPDVKGLLLDFKDGRWQASWRGENVRWQTMPHHWPAHEFSIASRGPTPHAAPRVLDVDGDGRNEVCVCRGGRTVEAFGLGPSGKVEVKWSVAGPEGSRLTVEGGSADHREVLVNVNAPAGRVLLAGCEGEAQAHYLRKNCLPLPALPMPMVADLDGDGTNEVLVQDARWVTRVLR